MPMVFEHLWKEYLGWRVNMILKLGFVSSNIGVQPNYQRNCGKYVKT
jgi:hypothetical protein